MAAALNSSETLPVTIPLPKDSFVLDLIPKNGVAFSSALIIAFLTFLYWQALPKPLPGIPYTKKSRWRFFGDAFDFVKYTKDTGEGFRWFATKAAETQSPIFQVFLAPFSKPVVIVADIQEVIDMATRRTREFDRGGFLTGWVGILFPEGTISMPSHDKFKDQRNIWSSTMTSQFLNSVSARTIHQHTTSLVKLWSTKTQLAKGRLFEVSDDLKQVTFDMVLAFFFPFSLFEKLVTNQHIVRSFVSVLLLSGSATSSELIRPRFRRAVMRMIMLTSVKQDMDCRHRR